MKVKIESIKKIIIAILALLSLLSLVMGCKNAINYSQDFQYDATKVLLMGMNPYDESLNPSEELLALGLEEYYLQMEANQFPSLLYLLAPYTLLSPLMARYAWLLSNLIFSGIIVFLLRKTFLEDLDKIDFAIVALLMFAGTPWRNHIGVGNHTIFAFMFFLLAVYFGKSENANIGKTILSAICLSVSYFKYTLTVPLALYFIYKRRFKELILSLVPHLILTVVAAKTVNDSLLDMIIKPLRVASALSGEGSMDIGALLGGGAYTVVFTIIILVGLLLCTFFLGEDKEKELITILIMFSMIMTYHRSYDYFVLVLPLGIQMGERAVTKFGLDKYMEILILFLFFVLRIFNESAGIMYLAAVLYYLYISFYVIMVIKGEKRK